MPLAAYINVKHLSVSGVIRSIAVYICAKQGLAANSSPHPMARSEWIRFMGPSQVEAMEEQCSMLAWLDGEQISWLDCCRALQGGKYRYSGLTIP